MLKMNDNWKNNNEPVSPLSKVKGSVSIHLIHPSGTFSCKEKEKAVSLFKNHDF